MIIIFNQQLHDQPLRPHQGDDVNQTSVGLSALKQQILSSGDDLMKPGSSLQGGSEKEVQTTLFWQQLYFCGSFLLTQKDHG